MSYRTIIYALVFVIAISWAYYYSTKPAPDFAAAHGGKVILYATSWCGYCTKTRDLLDKNNIDYFEYDVEKSEEGRKQFKALGGRGVPVLLIKGEVLKGFDPQRIIELTKSS